MVGGTGKPLLPMENSDEPSLLRFDRSVDTDELTEAAAFRGIPLSLVDAEPVEPYRHKLVLSRPDQHVAWRGDAPPDNPLTVIDTIRGAV